MQAPSLRSKGPRPVVPSRSSPAVWAAPLIVALVIFGWSSILGGGEFQPYLTGVLARAGIGLQYGLPVAAGAAAWASRRSRTIAAPEEMRVFGRASLRIWAGHLWPILVAVGVGYFATVLLSSVDVPIPGELNLTILVVYPSMTLTSVSFGWVLGAMIPIPISVPLAILAVSQWASYPLADPVNLSWRNIAGYATFMCCDFVEQALDPRAMVAPLLIAVALFIVSVLTVRVPLRQLGMPALVGVVLVGMAANALVAGTTATASSLRSSAEQVCVGESPRVCLYPEVPPQDRQLIAATLHEAYQRASPHGIEFAATVIAPAMDLPAGRDILVMDVSSASTADEILRAFAASAYAELTCSTSLVSAPARSDLPEEMIIAYALALVLGADSVGALPNFEIVEGGEGEPGQTVKPMPSDEAIELLGIDTPDAAAVVAQWHRDQVECGA